jgi:SsrA-binding protein
MPAAKKTVARAPTIQNRRARHDYEIIEVFEAGIQLVGSEVKSIREGHVQLSDCFGKVIDNEVFLIGLHIQPYSNAVGFGAHNPDRDRKLLLRRRQIDSMNTAVNEKQLQLIPLKLFFNEDGRVKVDLAIARGKKSYDKRHAIAARDAQRDEERESRRRR